MNTASGRPVIAEHGFVATRTGLDGFQPQLYAEAIQHGLLHAEHVLILADGAIWIWNLFEDRFTRAKRNRTANNDALLAIGAAAPQPGSFAPEKR